jgi:hypothetical protein
MPGSARYSPGKGNNDAAYPAGDARTRFGSSARTQYRNQHRRPAHPPCSLYRLTPPCLLATGIDDRQGTPEGCKRGFLLSGTRRGWQILADELKFCPSPQAVQRFINSYGAGLHLKQGSSETSGQLILLHNSDKEA